MCTGTTGKYLRYLPYLLGMYGTVGWYGTKKGILPYLTTGWYPVRTRMLTYCQSLGRRAAACCTIVPSEVGIPAPPPYWPAKKKKGYFES